jgi:hypothetical protein
MVGLVNKGGKTKYGSEGRTSEEENETIETRYPITPRCGEKKLVGK